MLGTIAQALVWLGAALLVLQVVMVLIAAGHLRCAIRTHQPTTVTIPFAPTYAAVICAILAAMLYLMR